MKLQTDWLLQGHIDFEYQKYMLLAYLQQVEASFSQSQVFPPWAELHKHHESLCSIRDSKQDFKNGFSKALEKIDLQRLELIYESKPEQRLELQELDSILEYSIPMLERYLGEGRDILNWVEEHVHVYPIGITPLYQREGYLFVPRSKEAVVYEYHLGYVQTTDVAYTRVQTRYVSSYSTGFSTTMESIKQTLVREFRPEWPNPAVYAIESRHQVPLEQTLLPVATKLLMQFIQPE